MTAFTAVAEPGAEARVAADLARIVEAVRAEAATDALLAVFLLGGYAKGEGAVVEAADGTPRGFNDYDLLLVFASPPARPERYAGLSRRLAGELEIDFVDLGLATPRNLAVAPPTLFWYELGEAHRLLWSRDDSPPRLRRIRSEDIDPAEGSRLLLNRGLALLWAGARLWSGSAPGRGSVSEDPAELRFVAIAAHKAVSAAGDAALLRAKTYVPGQARRQEILAGRPDLTGWAGRNFPEAYAKAAAYRRRPAPVAPGEAAALWWEAREHHERGFRAAEEARLRAAIPSWEEYSGMLRARAGGRPAGPIDAFRSAWRILRRSPSVDVEAGRMSAMCDLLYRTSVSEGEDAGASWKERTLALVGAWHP